MVAFQLISSFFFVLASRMVVFRWFFTSDNSYSYSCFKSFPASWCYTLDYLPGVWWYTKYHLSGMLVVHFRLPAIYVGGTLYITSQICWWYTQYNLSGMLVVHYRLLSGMLVVHYRLPERYVGGTL